MTTEPTVKGGRKTTEPTAVLQSCLKFWHGAFPSVQGGRMVLWLARIHTEDLEPEKYPYTHICSRFFITDEASDLYDHRSMV